MKYILIFCSLLLASLSFGARLFQPENNSTGTFKVLAVEKPVLECKKLEIGGSQDKSISPKGCILTLKKTSKVAKGESPLTEFRALGGEGSCEIQKGTILEKKVLHRECCMIVNFTGCTKIPEEHSTGMWAAVLDVWYIVDIDNFKKHRIDFTDSVLEKEWERPPPTPPQSIFSKIQDWFAELF
jgi:hypothetical protein